MCEKETIDDWNDGNDRKRYETKQLLVTCFQWLYLFSLLWYFLFLFFCAFVPIRCCQFFFFVGRMPLLSDSLSSDGMYVHGSVTTYIASHIVCEPVSLFIFIYFFFFFRWCPKTTDHSRLRDNVFCEFFSNLIFFFSFSVFLYWPCFAICWNETTDKSKRKKKEKNCIIWFAQGKCYACDEWRYVKRA